MADINTHVNINYTIIIIQMVSLWKDPEGKKVFSAHEAAMKITMLAESHSSTQVDQEVDALRQKVKQLKDAVEEYKVKQ